MQKRESEEQLLVLKNAVLSKISGISNKNSKNSIDELSVAFRVFLLKFLKLNYEFTDEELSIELKRSKIGKELKERIIDISEKFSEIKYKDKPIGAEDFQNLSIGITDLINSAIHPKEEETSSGFLPRIFKIFGKKEDQKAALQMEVPKPIVPQFDVPKPPSDSQIQAKKIKREKKEPKAPRAKSIEDVKRMRDEPEKSDIYPSSGIYNSREEEEGHEDAPERETFSQMEERSQIKEEKVDLDTPTPQEGTFVLPKRGEFDTRMKGPIQEQNKKVNATKTNSKHHQKVIEYETKIYSKNKDKHLIKIDKHEARIKELKEKIKTKYARPKEHDHSFHHRVIPHPSSKLIKVLSLMNNSRKLMEGNLERAKSLYMRAREVYLNLEYHEKVEVYHELLKVYDRLMRKDAKENPIMVR